jgi:hypothetical protein
MKKYFILFLFCPIFAFAQNASKKIGLGLNYVSLDLPDDLVYRPVFVFEKEFRNRFFVAAQFGGIYHEGEDNTFQIAELRRRFTTDITVKVAILRYKNNYLKIGGGPSLWYRNDNLVNSVRFEASPPDFIPKPIGFDMMTKKDWNLGYNLTGELEVLIIKRVSLAAHFSVADLGKAGFSSVLGLNCYYKLGNPIFSR